MKRSVTSRGNPPSRTTADGCPLCEPSVNRLRLPTFANSKVGESEELSAGRRGDGTAPSRKNSWATELIVLEESLSVFMRERNEPEAKRVLNEILGRIMLGSGFETMKARIVELIVVISRAVADPNNAEQVLEDNQKLIENALAFEDMGDLCEWMTAVLERYLGYIFITEQNASRIVRKALAYMDGRFASPALPLAEVAHAAGVSREYLSRIFKRETGQSFGAYMTKQRVDHAKKMLSAAADSGDVALACGFSDTSYFCKVFKKNTGVTPGAWRNLRVR